MVETTPIPPAVLTFTAMVLPTERMSRKTIPKRILIR
jgi:hypothetical protein